MTALGIVLGFALALTSCGRRGVDAANNARSRAAAYAGFPVAVTDDAGRRVTIPRPPARLISLAPSHTETLYALGLGDRVVAADIYSDYPPEARARAMLNAWPRPPLERIVALKPDLVLVLTEGEEALRGMQRAGIRVLKVAPRKFEDVADGIRLIGRATGAEARAEELAGSLLDLGGRIREHVGGLPRPRVLYELDGSDPARPWVIGSGDFMGDLLELAGGQNIFAEIRRPAGQVSLEEIIARDPEVILADSDRHAAQIRRRRAWARLSGVRQERVFAVDGHAFTRPGPRLGRALVEIANRLHPERPYQ